MKINRDIKLLCEYALNEKLINETDYDYVLNKLTNLLQIKDIKSVEIDNIDVKELSILLDPILDYAYEIGAFTPNTISQRDLFEAKVMDIFIPRPSTINYIFNQKLKDNPVKATDYFYTLSQKSNYIKTSRTSKNVKWKSETPYGTFDITINLSKPEKDPRDIINQSGKKSSSYPKCLLCKEQVGFYGDQNKPGRTNHRIISMKLNNEDFYLQYSPYVYYNEHSIVLKRDHVPMNVTVDTFKRLFDFIDILPHYFLGSNAGLPIVGGSILSHEHYQGGRYKFPIESAKVLKKYVIKDVVLKQLYWPLSVVRLESSNRESLIKTADKLYKFWEKYNDSDAGIVSFTDKPHNAITPIARKKGDIYILDIALRNNLTSDLFPLGIFHPHPKNHHIKKENIGLIEVMGLAILPSRLVEELAEIKQALLENSDLPIKYNIHNDWLKSLKKTYSGEEIDAFINEQVALKFVQCIEDSGVFKQTKEGTKQFDKFIGGLISVLD